MYISTAVHTAYSSLLCYNASYKLMLLSEWREFPSAPCIAGGKKTWWKLASRCYWIRARPWHASELVSFPVGLRTYQHPGTRSLSSLISPSNMQLSSKKVKLPLLMLIGLVWAWSYTCTLSYNLAINGGQWSFYRPAPPLYTAASLEKKILYPLNRRLGGPWSRGSSPVSSSR